ncbi:MAG: hypothetical protein JST51_15895 [Armatimonadetes bacterium]|nr:hypothetical protein [Armatimonadota bacterium]
MKYVQAFLNARTLRFAAIGCFVIFLILYGIMTALQPQEKSEATKLGILFGKLSAASKQISEAANIAKTFRSTPLPRLADADAMITDAIPKIKTLNEKARILVFLDPLHQAIDAYSSALEKGDANSARGILVGQVVPTDTGLKQVLDKAESSLDENIDSQTQVRKMFRILFIVLGCICVLFIPTFFRDIFGVDKEDSFHSLLQHSLAMPTAMAIAGRFQKELKGREELEELSKAVARMTVASLHRPHTQEYLTGKKRSLIELDFDLANELKDVAAFARLIGDGDSTIASFPGSIIQLQGWPDDLGLALINWMSELSRKQDVTTFDLNFEKIDQDWVVMLSSRGVELRPEIADAYSSILAKKAGIDAKHHDELDFVRAVLRRHTKKTVVTSENGNLNLVMTFTPQ